MHSAIYRGQVFHQRHRPTRHKFDYKIDLFWLDLDEIADIAQNIKYFSSNGFAPFQFKRSDYVGDNSVSLKKSVLNKATELNGGTISGKVFLLGQLRTFGLYFSPVNFYFVQDADHHYTHMLAEVSNTPWNERHYYLVDLKEQSDTEKAFHVSPFNPMDMIYKWRIEPPSETLSLTMHCDRQKRVFSAGLRMTRFELNPQNLRHVMIQTPSMTIKTVVGIYWQALKLWLKRTPVYDHPIDSQGQK